MIDRATKLRWRRRFRRGQHKALDLTEQADEHLEKHLIKRISKFSQIKRFILTWISLLLLLISGLVLELRQLGRAYLIDKPVPGGIYTEGVMGVFTNANPIYASGTVDNAVSKLVFSGLLKYNEQNTALVGDLAEKIEVDQKETTYTVTLRKDLKWHDGQPLTALDVVFTFQTAQNADAKSPLFTSWQGITIEARDDHTVIFKLPNAFSAFPHSLTTGILPFHVLGQVPKAQMRSQTFNTELPIGSGPFKWQAIELYETEGLAERQQSIGLEPYEHYHFGKPKLAKFVIRTYQQETSLINAFKQKQVSATVGLSSVPEELKSGQEILEYSIPLTGGVFAFFNNSNDLLADKVLRQALALAASPNEVIVGLGYPALRVDSPILRKGIGYNPSLTQATNNLEEARKLLDQAGWVSDPASGLRQKGDRKLAFKLFSESTSEYQNVAQILQRQWREAGIDVEVILMPGEDLQSTLAGHDYDILLYGIAIGADSDVYAYWHSSQADPRAANRLNFSEYKNTTADLALEAGRTRSDPAIRNVKYKPFLEAWKADNPALGLYQPRFLYLAHKPLHNFNPTTMNQTADRFVNVHNWMIREEKAAASRTQ